MGSRNEIIDRKINNIESNLLYEELALEFAEKKGNESEVERLSKAVESLKEDIEIWEGMKE